MDPLYQNQEDGFYPNAYSMHDLGSNYPNATGHIDGADEYMPVEVSAAPPLIDKADKYEGEWKHGSHDLRLLPIFGRLVLPHPALCNFETMDPVLD